MMCKYSIFNRLLHVSLFLMQTLFVNINEDISLHIFTLTEELVINKIQRITLSQQIISSL